MGIVFCAVICVLRSGVVVMTSILGFNDDIDLIFIASDAKDRDIIRCSE